MNFVNRITEAKRKVLTDDWKLLVSAIMLMAMVFIRDMDVFYFTPMHFLLVNAIIAFVLPYESLIVFAFFHISFEFSILCTTDIPIIFALILKSKCHNNFQFVFAGLIILFELLHVKLVYEHTSVSSVELNEFVVYAVYVVVFSYLLFTDRYNNEIIKQCIKYYVIGTSFVLFVMFYHYISVGSINELLYADQRFGNTYGAFTDASSIDKVMYTVTNPNNAAYFSLTAFTLSLYIKGIFKSIILKIPCMTILVLAGLLTTSRTWILLMGLVLFIYFFYGTGKSKIWLVVATISVMLVALHFTAFTDSLLGRFGGRFSDEDIATAGSRTNLISAYNDYMLAHPEKLLYGAGVLRYNEFIRVGQSIHNGLQQIFVCYGFLGILLFVSIAMNFYQRYGKRNKTTFWNCVPFIACFLFDQSIQFLTPHMLMLPFTVCLLPLKLRAEK